MRSCATLLRARRRTCGKDRQQPVGFAIALTKSLGDDQSKVRRNEQRLTPSYCAAEGHVIPTTRQKSCDRRPRINGTTAPTHDPAPLCLMGSRSMSKKLKAALKRIDQFFLRTRRDGRTTGAIWWRPQRGWVRAANRAAYDAALADLPITEEFRSSLRHPPS